MAGIGMVFGLIGSVVSAMGSMAAANAEAAAQEANARALEKKAMEERAVASVEASKKMDEQKRLVSEQTARFAASGGGVGGGPGFANSATTVIRETEKEGLHNSRLAAWEGEQKGRGYEDQAAIARFSAAQKKKAAGIGAGAAILSGFSKIGGSFIGGGGGQTSYGGDYYFGT